MTDGGVHIKAGGDVLSHRVSSAVPSVLEGLTTVFGMGTGVTLPLNRQPNSNQGEGGVQDTGVSVMRLLVVLLKTCL